MTINVYMTIHIKSVNRNKDIFKQRKERFMLAMSKGELEGVSNTNIAIRFGISYTVVTSWKKEYNNIKMEATGV